MPSGFHGNLTEWFAHSIMVNRVVDYLLFIIYVRLFGTNIFTGTHLAFWPLLAFWLKLNSWAIQ